MAFFGLQEAHLARENRFFGGRKSKLRIKTAGVFSNELCREILLSSKKNYFFCEKSCQAIYYLFFKMTRGASSYNIIYIKT
jgi:hypothetical protein